MKMTVNGIPIHDTEDGIDIRFQVDEAGEEIGRIAITTSGGVLRVRSEPVNEQDGSIHFQAENGGCLLLGNGTVMGDDRPRTQLRLL